MTARRVVRCRAIDQPRARRDGRRHRRHIGGAIGAHRHADHSRARQSGATRVTGKRWHRHHHFRLWVEGQFAGADDQFIRTVAEHDAAGVDAGLGGDGVG